MLDKEMKNLSFMCKTVDGHMYRDVSTLLCIRQCCNIIISYIEFHWLRLAQPIVFRHHCLLFQLCMPTGGWWEVARFEDASGSVSMEIGQHAYLMALDNGLLILGPQHQPGMPVDIVQYIYIYLCVCVCNFFGV